MHPEPVAMARIGSRSSVMVCKLLQRCGCSSGRSKSLEVHSGLVGKLGESCL